MSVASRSGRTATVLPLRQPESKSTAVFLTRFPPTVRSECQTVPGRTTVGRMTSRSGSARSRLRASVRDTWQELRARRAGRKGLQPGIARATRDVTGPTGWVWSNAWQQLDDHGDAYMKSFDRRLPPSIFVSERDRTRHNQPIPVAERCLEDAGAERAALQAGRPITPER